jgi:ribonuclease BN (tRNA processing enzyme)
VGVKVVPVACLKDNYAWLLVADDETLWFVDPGEAESALYAARGKGLPITGVLLTHHHADHVGGVEGIREAYPNVKVYGPAADAARLPPLDVALEPGRFSFAGMSAEMRAGTTCSAATPSSAAAAVASLRAPPMTCVSLSTSPSRTYRMRRSFAAATSTRSTTCASPDDCCPTTTP